MYGFFARKAMCSHILHAIQNHSYKVKEKKDMKVRKSSQRTDTM